MTDITLLQCFTWFCVAESHV